MKRTELYKPKKVRATDCFVSGRSVIWTTREDITSHDATHRTSVVAHHHGSSYQY